MSIAVPLQQAAAGKISTGDLIDVIAPNGEGGARYVAQGLRVIAVAPTSAAGVLGGLSTSYYVLVAVDKQTALRLTAALGVQGAGGTGGQLEIVRSTGERETAQVLYDASSGPSAVPKGA
jgi:hypothetical protein